MRNIINIATLILAPAHIDHIQIPRFTFYINVFRRGLGPPALVFYYNKNRYTLLERIDNALSKRGKSKKGVHSLTLINAHSQAILNSIMPRTTPRQSAAVETNRETVRRLLCQQYWEFGCLRHSLPQWSKSPIL